MARKKIIKRKERARKEKSLLQKVLGVLILVAALTVGIYYFTSTKNIPGRIAQEIAVEENSDAKDSLQLGTFTPPPTAPPPAPPPKENACVNHDTGRKIKDDPPTCKCTAYVVKCENNKCVEFNYDLSRGTGILIKNPDCKYWDQQGWCAPPFATDGDGWYCIGKPVIYLYPEVPTYVDVRVKTAGEIFVSDPPIEKLGGLALSEANGWKNVFSEPNGKLTYKGKTYRELFYESNVKEVKKPSSGLTLATNNIREELDKTISRLGLIGEEKIEFLDFWVPKLQGFKSPYVFFGIVEKEEKDRIDKVIIDPKPDTFIEFIAYFSPLEKPFEGKKLELPSSPPSRVGFTAVEWGGTVGK